jgi:hypothetical protein
VEDPQPNIFNTPSNNHREILIESIEDQGIPRLPTVPSKSIIDGCFQIRAAVWKKEGVQTGRV